ncbi:phosphoethanolamine transferase [Brenneria roseae subsp. americana]|uniref:Phosphoethanolamine transferase n=1 Tax=Brenneria roseae subsp. americana TaxID=1508507 RepID=A0A2U1TY23_9GAMM|nr:LTA synthase family protein [Brenneria roseae]PWC14313.1 phosphoethanolamine transferase [Brenneria roseae subsp. americana]
MSRTRVLFCYFFIVIIASFIIVANNSKHIYPVIISVLSYIFIVSAVFTTSRRWLFSLVLSSSLFITLKLIDQIKIHYYKEKLLFPDFYLIFDSANAETLAHYWLAGVAMIALLLWLLLNAVLSWRCHPVTRKTPYRLAAVVLIPICLFGITNITDRCHRIWEETLPKGTGTLTNIIMSASDSYYQPPQYPGTSAYFLEKAQTVTLPATQSDIRPDIVVLLHESTVNPLIYQLPDQSVIPPLFTFQHDDHVSAQSLMRVHTFGGGTWLSEFSVLTGLNPDDFGSRKNAVFYTVIDHIAASLFQEMKANGYYTVVLTPFNKSAYHAGHAYQTLGVDRIIQPQELGYPGRLSENLWNIPTHDVLKYVKTLIGQKTDKPIFVYVLTMAEHGPYDDGHKDDFNLNEHISNPGTAGKFSHYVEKITASDAAIKEFSHYVAENERPMMFLYFGDHQPGIGFNQYRIKQNNPAYISQFTLRDNLTSGQHIKTGELTDISFIGGIILERARLNISPFYQANIQMRHLCSGMLDDCQDKTLLDSYKKYIYHDLKIAGE